jgi:hypothetical protein
MKQLIQNLKTGETVLEDVPVPLPGQGQVLIRTCCSLVSLGTERMLVEFGKANLLQKARQQPDKVKQVLDKIRTDGLMPTLLFESGLLLPISQVSVKRWKGWVSSRKMWWMPFGGQDNTPGDPRRSGHKRTCLGAPLWGRAESPCRQVEDRRCCAGLLPGYFR